MNRKKLQQLRNKILENLNLGKQELLKKQEEQELTSRVKSDILAELQEGTLAFRKFEKLFTKTYWRDKYGKYASNTDLSELTGYLNFLEEILQSNNETKQVFLEKGDVFKGRTLIRNNFKEAAKSLFLIDNYLDLSILEIIGEVCDENQNIDIKVLTVVPHSKVLLTDLRKFTQQYTTVAIKTTQNIHDRYLIVDNIKLIHSGHSFKDLGSKKCTVSYVENTEQISKEISRFETEWNTAQDFI